MNYSVTYTGLVVMLLSLVLRVSGIDFVEADLQSKVQSVVELFAILVSVYGRWRKGDVSILGVKN